MKIKNSNRPSRPGAGGNSERSTRTQKKKKTKLNYRFIGLCAGVLVVILIGVFCGLGADALHPDTICHGVLVNGINLGGLTEQQALEALQNGASNPYEMSSVTLNTDEGKSVTINAATVNAQPDYTATAKAAMSVAKSSGLLANMWESFCLHISNRDLHTVVVYDHAKLDEELNRFAEDVGGSLKQHHIDVGDENVTITPGESGMGVDIETARTTFIENLKENKQTHVKLKLKDTDPAAINIDELYEMTYRAPVDAHYERSNGSVIIASHQDGREIDREKAAAALKDFKPGSKPVTLEYITLAASVKEDSLSTRFFSDTLGSFSTKYDSSNRSRSNNVALAAKNINGTILLPGEEFSYNKSVGPRTYDRGFKDASVYENNKQVDGVGGGICQTSSTLYAAVLYANLQVVERHEHSLEVHYAPLGMDATVAWGSLDFRFKNNTDHPIKVNASASGGTVSVSIVGTNPHPDWTIKIDTETISTTPFTVKEVPTDELPAGKTEVESTGFKGHIVNTYKIIYQNGKEIDRKFLHKSVYNMAPKVIKVGTGGGGSSPSQAPVPSPPAEEPTAPPQQTEMPTEAPVNHTPNPPVSNTAEPPANATDAPVSNPNREYPEGL